MSTKVGEFQLSQPQRKLLGVRSLPFRVQCHEGTFFLEPEDEAGVATRLCEPDGNEKDVTDYIVGFYNCVRQHSALGNIAPIIYEQQVAKCPISVSKIA